MLRKKPGLPPSLQLLTQHLEDKSTHQLRYLYMPHIPLPYYPITLIHYMCVATCHALSASRSECMCSMRVIIVGHSSSGG